MLRRTLFLVISFLLVPGLRAQDSSAPRASEPEEPDFAFLSGSAYTQGKYSMQVIHQTALRTRRFLDPVGDRNEDEFLFFQRIEYGLTNRWELDFVLPAAGSRTRLNGRTTASSYALADGLAGIRYRLLEEGAALVTLATGPQLIFPSGSVRRGTGAGSAGFTWDLAVSKDWGGPVFLYTTANYRVLPSADDPTPGSSQRFTLHGADWATAIGVRPLERREGSNKHDVHAFVEAGGSWQQQIEPVANFGLKRGVLSWTFVTGVRYGFLTSRKTLIELGVATPMGIGPNGPKRGIVIQFQYEWYFSTPKEQ